MGNSVNFHYRVSKINLLCHPFVSEHQRDDFTKRSVDKTTGSETLRLIFQDILTIV